MGFLLTIRVPNKRQMTKCLGGASCRFYGLRSCFTKLHRTSAMTYDKAARNQNRCGRKVIFASRNYLSDYNEKKVEVENEYSDIGWSWFYRSKARN